MKGGSSTQQTKNILQFLGAVTFIVGIVYGLYVVTRDPDTWGNSEWIATISVVFLFLTSIVLYQIADSIGGHGKKGYRGGKGGKDDCHPSGHSGHGGGHGYSYSGSNVASVGADDLTDTN